MAEVGTKPNPLTYEEWLAEFRFEAVTKYGFTAETVLTLDDAAYKDSYYDAGYSPADALYEDMSYGDAEPEDAEAVAG